MDGICHDILWNEFEEDGIFRNMSEENETTDCEDGDSDTV